MNPQYSFWQKIIVPFLIGVLFFAAYLVFRNNPSIMNPGPYYLDLVKNRESTDALIQKPNLQDHPWSATITKQSDRVSHRLLPVTASEFESSTGITTDDDLSTQFVGLNDQFLSVLKGPTQILVQNTTGQVLWSFSLPHNHKFSPGAPTLQGQSLWASTTNGRVYAFDLLTGNVLWHSSGNAHFFLSPLVQNDNLVLFIEEKNNQLWDLEIVQASTGQIKNRFGHFELPFSGTPLVQDNILYYATQTGHMTAINLETGKEVWTAEGSSSFRSPVSLINDRLYVANEDGLLLGYDRRNGRKVSEIEIGSTVHEKLMLIEGTNTAITVDNAGFLLALDLKTNKREWRYNLNQTGRGHPLALYRLTQQSFNQLNFASELRGWTVWAACSGARLCIFDAKKGLLLHRLEMNGRLKGDIGLYVQPGADATARRTWLLAPVSKNDRTQIAAWATPAPKTVETPAAAEPTPPPAKTE